MRQLASPSRATFMLRYFRTGPGEYGEGDRFLGLMVPQIRQIAREFRDLPLPDIQRLVRSSWHEARMLALLILVGQYTRGDVATKATIYRLYLRNTTRINNWDLVDLSAPQIVGAHLQQRSRAPLYRLARSPRLWERRIAIVATQYLIARGDFDDTLKLATQLLADRDDLIHKATGWMLREVGKRDERTLTRFLDRHAGRMPRTALRYSIERLSSARKRQYMSMPRQPTRR